MTTMQFRTANVSWASAYTAVPTGHGRGAAHLDERLEHDYDLLPLRMPNPDAIDEPLAQEYARYVGKHVDEPTTELLDRLSDEHGLMWLTIARVAQVSVPALRKWRHGGRITPENKAALARLLSACGRLEELGVQDVAAWLSAPIRLGQNRQRVELLALPEGGGEALLALAEDRIGATEALDVLDPGWRQHQPGPTTEITVGSDGMTTVHLAET